MQICLVGSKVAYSDSKVLLYIFQFLADVQSSLLNALIRETTIQIILKCVAFVTTALEPFFNAAASQFILGHQIPLTLWASLAPIVLGK